MENMSNNLNALRQFVSYLHSPLGTDDDLNKTYDVILKEMKMVSTNIEPILDLIGFMNGLRRDEIPFVSRMSQTELAGLVNHILAESGTKPSDLIKLIIGFSYEIEPQYVALIAMMIHLHMNPGESFDDEWISILESDHSLAITGSGMSFRTD